MQRCRQLSPPPDFMKQKVAKQCSRITKAAKMGLSACLTYWLPNITPTILLTGACAASFVYIVSTRKAPMSSDTYSAILKGGSFGFALKFVRFLTTGKTEVPLALAETAFTKIFYTVLRAIELPTYPACAVMSYKLSDIGHSNHLRKSRL